MSRDGIARVWSVLGALLTLYSIGTWILVQGGKPFADIPGLDSRGPVSSAYQAVLVTGVLLGLLGALGVRHVKMVANAREPLLPVVGIADTGPHEVSSWSMRIYQGFFFLCFILLPAAALFQLNKIVLQEGILWNDADPALGSIAAKNAYPVFAGSSAQDRVEWNCRESVLRGQGRVWLANRRCDVVKAKGLAPFENSGASASEDAARANGSPQCVRDLAISNAPQHGCIGPRDISELCEASSRRCRGVEWLPLISPLALLLACAIGWGGAGWLIAELWIHRRRRRIFPGRSNA